MLDSEQEQTRIGCKLSTIPGFAVGTAFASGSGMQQPLPNPGDQEATRRRSRSRRCSPTAVKKAAFVYAKFPATQETRDKEVAGYPKAGWKFLNCDQTYNIAGESDWKPIATNLKKCGVASGGVGRITRPQLRGPPQRVEAGGLHAEGVGQPIRTSTPRRSRKWNEQNGGAGNNVYVRMTGVPFELANQVPAVKQYMDLVAKSHGTIGLLGEQSASAFLLWATGVKACGSNVTAKCVLDNAAKQTNWTAGGLHIPTDPGDEPGRTCGMLLKLDGAQVGEGRPDRLGELFDCNPKYLVEGAHHLGGHRGQAQRQPRRNRVRHVHSEVGGVRGAPAPRGSA